MRVLEASELTNPSGGIEPSILVLGALTALNTGLVLYNFLQLNSLHETVKELVNYTDFIYNWSIYHDAQLSKLPGYDEIANLSFDDAAKLSGIGK